MKFFWQVVIFGLILPFYKGQNGSKFSQNRSGQAGVGVADTFWLFIFTLNRAKKWFNSIFNSKLNRRYSFNELFIQYSVRNIDSKFYSKNWIKTIQIYVIKPTQWKPAKRERFPKIGLEFINSRFGSLFRLPRVPIRSLLYLLFWSWVPISKLAGFRNRGMWGPGDLKGPFLSIVTPIEEKNANYSQITYACQDFWFIKSFIQFLLAK